MAGRLVMAVTGQMRSHTMQAMSQGVSTAIVSKGLTKPASCGQTAIQAAHWMQAFQFTSKSMAGRSGIGCGDQTVRYQTLRYGESGLKYPDRVSWSSRSRSSTVRFR